MALNFTRVLCGRNFALQCMNLRSSPVLAARSITLKSVTPKAEDNVNYDDKNSRLGRPLSPHLTIYKTQLTAMLSITHRLTGMALAGYVAAFGVGALVLPHDFSYYIDVIEAWNLSSTTLFATKFAIAFPFCYHLFNGIRHLLWDTGKFLRISEVYKTGYAMLIVSIITTIILSAM